MGNQIAEAVLRDPILFGLSIHADSAYQQADELHGYRRPCGCHSGLPVESTLRGYGCLECGGACCPACAIILESAAYCCRCAAALLDTTIVRVREAFELS